MIDYMADPKHPLKRSSYLDAPTPRVPPLYPPLDHHSDLLIVSPEAPLTPSFAELLLEEDRSQHGREGRLSTDGGVDAKDLQRLRDSVLALQVQNSKLSVCLQQERQRRRQCEETIQTDRRHIQQLEDTIKNLQKTRLVMEPNMYRQIAESYMASRKAGVRRTCSSTSPHYEDLVCDSPPTVHKEDVNIPLSSPSPTSRIPSTHPSYRPAQLRQWSSDSNDSGASFDQTFFTPSSQDNFLPSSSSQSSLTPSSTAPQHAPSL